MFYFADGSWGGRRHPPAGAPATGQRRVQCHRQSSKVSIRILRARGFLERLLAALE
jgi:hypothetical protein